MILKPQDVLVLLKLLTLARRHWSYAWLAGELGMSPSQLHAAVGRGLAARLAVQEGDGIVPQVGNLKEFLIHGLEYVFVPEWGEMTRGMPTAHAAPPLNAYFAPDTEPPPVWPDPTGEVKGIGFSPLYKAAPWAARRDGQLYELLTLVDAIRSGRGREREIAVRELGKRFRQAGRHDKARLDTEDMLVIGKDLLVSRNALRALAGRFHIKKLTMFGSAARAELRPDSDIDLLVEFEPEHTPSLGGMVAIQDALSALFGHRRVDLATPSILENPYRRWSIERDMEELYAA